jgi:hypothetical protein
MLADAGGQARTPEGQSMLPLRLTNDVFDTVSSEPGLGRRLYTLRDYLLLLRSRSVSLDCEG